MTWEISGTYVGNCTCSLICPCPVDGVPTGPDGECRGFNVFHIATGTMDETDLSGVDFAFFNWFPTNLSAGGWKVGAVVDEGASDAQVDALESILRGQAGGPFGDFAALYGDWLGLERASVSFSDGDTPSASVAGRVVVTFEPLPGPDGGVTTVKNAMFGFAPEFRIGKGPGHPERFGMEFDGVYGETSDFTFASEMAEGAPKGRG
ncbi:hypothetical protein ASF98_19440 [Arthrobacter sp. Leaf337]|uniref:DUF1326 domain-containing protein n=1 Tax=Arthrobacter sp. Leaf337 TaxID=1736342 RepID=UPI0006F8E7DC|nr:DUF1326 domain-containing protein [Arthrobacter sp. Leaf337]KQR80119.1 hypothetical protein ASF98_19440 [Arthrobacter sp. Leaf337]